MRRHLTTMALLLAALLLFPAAAGARTKASSAAKTKAGSTASTAPKKSKAPKVAAKKAPAKKAAAAKAPAPEPEEAPVPEEPPSPPVSQAVVDALATGDLPSALVVMREEKETPKLKYLMTQASRAALFDIKKAPDRSEAHKAYQNVGVSYHNLYLFLKSRGIDQKRYFKEAQRSYGKARGAGTVLHKAECDVLLAALLAASGDREKAAKLFGKVDTSLLRGDFESAEYLATYFAAAGETERALDELAAAHKIDPDRTLAWVTVGDDFAPLEEDARYGGLIDSWHGKARERREIQLSVPRSSGKPRLEMASPDIQFAPQKMMRHASSKEAAEVSKKGVPSKKKSAAASKKSSKTKASTKKVAKKSKIRK